MRKSCGGRQKASISCWFRPCLGMLTERSELSICAYHFWSNNYDKVFDQHYDVVGGDGNYYPVSSNLDLKF